MFLMLLNVFCGGVTTSILFKNDQQGHVHNSIVAALFLFLFLIWSLSIWE